MMIRLLEKNNENEQSSTQTLTELHTFQYMTVKKNFHNTITKKQKNMNITIIVPRKLLKQEKNSTKIKTLWDFECRREMIRIMRASKKSN